MRARQVCARVKIEIKQELTLERQAFDAEMRITNSLPATALTKNTGRKYTGAARDFFSQHPNLK